LWCGTLDPFIGEEFGQKYSESSGALDLSIRAMPVLLNTIGKALNRVASWTPFAAWDSRQSIVGN
jgi:hypothetical protein